MIADQARYKQSGVADGIRIYPFALSSRILGAVALLEAASESDRRTIETRIAQLRERLFGESPSEQDQADPPDASGD